MAKRDNKKRLERLNQYIDNIEHKLDEKKEVEEKVDIFSYKGNFIMLPCDLIGMVLKSEITEMELRAYIACYSMAYGYKPFESNLPTGRTGFISKTTICKHTNISLQNMKGVFDKLLSKGLISIYQRMTLKSGEPSERHISYTVNVPVTNGNGIEWVQPEKAWYLEKKEEILNKTPVMKITKIRTDKLSDDIKEIYGKDIYELLDDINKITFVKSVIINGEQLRALLKSLGGSEDNLKEYIRVRSLKSYDKLISLVVEKALNQK